MKRIITGKRYDTEKAIKIGEASSNNGRRDFRWYDEALYRTPRSGVYFLAGEGGAMSRWSKSCGGRTWCGGEGILPLDREDALEWAERHLSAEQIEAAFGDAIADA